MESLLSDTYSSSKASSREQSLDQSEYLQVPMLLSPDCNGTTFHLPDHCYDDAPLTSHNHSDQEEEEIEEVNAYLFHEFVSANGKSYNIYVNVDSGSFNWRVFQSEGAGILMASHFCYS